MKSSVSDVVYVHGLWLNGAESALLRRRVSRELGARFHTFRYPTVSCTIHETAARLRGFIERLGASRVDLIGHSLGGLVVYRLLESSPHLPPGAVVFLGTPAVASIAAVRAARFGPIAALLGKIVKEELLCERERAWQFDRPLGIIAGTQRLGLGQWFARFDESCDGTISVRETRLPGATDHIALPVSHMGMLVSARVARQTSQFLREARFKRTGS